MYSDDGVGDGGVNEGKMGNKIWVGRNEYICKHWHLLLLGARKNKFLVLLLLLLSLLR